MHLEDMEKSQPNMEIDVIISTAGEGLRLRKVNSEINKSLLPYLNKPIIYHIIEKIPSTFKIGILLGYKSQQVRDFLTLAYPKREFTYIYVDDWTSSKSGTKYSLTFAYKLLRKSFWYFPCDGIYQDTDFLLDEFPEDVFLVCKIDKNKAYHYLTFMLEKNRIVNQFFKSTEVTGDYAFTGVMRVVDKELFFSRLGESNSNEFVSIIPDNSLIYLTENWKDLGNFEMYEDEISKTEGFDFSKSGEYTYQLNESIVKWWPDPAISNNKLEKPKIKPDVFPKNIESLNQFLSYSKANGSPFYERVNQKNFTTLLNWLQNKLWFPQNLNIEENLLQFYKNKTQARIDLLGNKKELPSYNPKNINGINVQPWQNYLKNINWDLLIQVNKPSFIHGDLQFDNIIYDDDTKQFTLIDWRSDFAGLKSIGDLYYDFAKMLGGIHVNYHEIKQGKFKFNYHDGKVVFELPAVDESKELISILESFIAEMELDVIKVRKLVPLIFWNMAPLHKEPFANLCWSLGIFHYETLKQC
jgi:choline kinase